MRACFIAAVVLIVTACSGRQVLNTLTPSGGYGVVSGVAYDAPNGLRLDVYAPHGVTNAPVVVFFYGGRWQSGARAEYKFVGQALASQGFVAILPDVRKYPAVRFPEFVRDAAKAVRWARANAARYKGDPGKLFVMGHSSGAHIAALVALDGTYLREVGGSRAWLRGMIGLAGAYDFLPLTAGDLRDLFGPPERFPDSQPVNFCDGDHPALLLLHGENDETADVKNTRSLAAAVARGGGAVETVIYPDMPHGWMVATLAATLRGRSDALAQIADFVRRKSA